MEYEVLITEIRKHDLENLIQLWIESKTNEHYEDFMPVRIIENLQMVIEETENWIRDHNFKNIVGENNSL
jgi:hypothetical protein